MWVLVIENARNFLKVFKESAAIKFSEKEDLDEEKDDLILLKV